MLKNVPSILSPELMKVLMEMGHGDEIVLADGNFPAASNAQRLLRCDGHGVPELLEAVLTLFPLDIYLDQPVALMSVVPGDDTKPTIWEQYRQIVKDSGEKAWETAVLCRRYRVDRAARSPYLGAHAAATPLFVEEWSHVRATRSRARTQTPVSEKAGQP